MAHLSLYGNALPVPAPSLKQGANFFVKVGAHDASIAKVCALSKQPIAHSLAQSVAMAKTLNQILAATLREQMEKKGFSSNKLGAAAGISPRTIANYLAGDDPDPVRAKSGKPRSAKLQEVEMLADALGVPAQVLLTDPESRLKLAAHIMSEVVSQLDTTNPKSVSRKLNQRAA